MKTPVEAGKVSLHSASFQTLCTKKNEAMKNILLLILSTCFLVSCSNEPKQFSNTMRTKHSLPVYSLESLKDPVLKAKSAFIFTLLGNTQELRVHQFNGANENVVYVKDDKIDQGYPEAVFKVNRDEAGNKTDTGTMVSDPENMGSFNYRHPVREPLGHFSEDMYPWIIWGNSREDSTTREQRITAYVQDIELALERLVSSNSGYYLPQNFSFNESGQSETVAFFIAALEKENFDLYDFIMNGQSSPSQRKLFYKSLETGFNKMFNK